MIKKLLKIIKESIKFLFIFFTFFFLFLSQVIQLGTVWAKKNYSYSSFDEILYTLGTSVTTASKEVLDSFFECNVYPPLWTTLILFIIFITVYVTYRIIFRNCNIYLKFKIFSKNLSIKINFMAILFLIFLSATVFSTVNSVNFAMDKLYIGDYLEANTKSSEFFEKNYVNPRDVELEFPKEKRNLIYIYLESMEATYSDENHGGAYPYNYIPNLTDLAYDYINFSSNEDVGGAYMTIGTTWTMGGLVAETAGVPIKNVFGANSEESYENGLVNGAYALGDILEDKGYHQSIMVGSDLSFGGRRSYFEGHGDYEVFDLYTARDDGIIPDDYYVFWGYEDEKLFDYAKQELEKLSDSDEPFNFSMLTVDTHATDGYTSDFCPDYSSDSYLNSVYCSDMQLGEFIEWIQDQDFYEDTTIVLTGDHISMNNYSFDDIDEDYERGVYNVYINSAVETDNNKNREFTTFDYFPTTLAALGVKIQGNRLGLGTNLFSDKKTLSEKYGNDYINDELSKRSTYYDACINLNQCK